MEHDFDEKLHVAAFYRFALNTKISRLMYFLFCNIFERDEQIRTKLLHAYLNLVFNVGNAR